MKKHKNIVLYLVFFFLGVGYTYSSNTTDVELALQQQKTVKGRVVDLVGEPMVGVSVVDVTNRTNGTVTDHDGNYSLNVSNNSILSFSFIGYVDREIEVRDQSEISVILQEDVKLLDEIVVIGYGEQTRRDLTGSVSVLNPEEMVKAPVISFAEALAGRVAGVSVSAIDGQPGSDMNIIIRGANSITQSNSPLYVIDGFPLEDFNAASINMEDIKTFNILKDASSTAIYGSRGANGVIVIETKKGLESKPIIEFSTTFGIANVRKKMEMMNPYEFVKYQLDLNPTAGKSSYLLEDRTLDYYKTVEGINWQEQIFRTALVQNYNLAVRGGTRDTKYAVSGSAFKQPGVVLSTGSDSYLLRSNLDQRLNEKMTLTLNTNLGYTSNYGQLVSSGDGGTTSSYLLYRTWAFRPVAGRTDINLLEEVSDPDNISGADVRLNPVITSENDYTRNNTVSVMSNLGFRYSIIRGLQFRAAGTIRYNQEKRNVFYNSKTTQGSPLNPNNKYGVNGSTRNSDSFTWNAQATLDYNKTINGAHRLGLMGGSSMQERQFEQYGYGGFNILYEQLGMSGLDTGSMHNAIAMQTTNRLASFFGRFNYGYHSKYLVTFTLRADGSSKFPYNKWGYFPSGALAWNMHEESFMKNVNQLNSLKLRASYGATGNNRVDDFAAYSQMTVNPNRENPSYSFNNGEPGRGLVSTVLGNARLKWETTWQTDLGVDISAFNDRVGLTMDYYMKDTHDLLLQADAPRTMGFPSIMKNVGRVKNNGLEITLNTLNVQTSDFQWSTTFNIAFNRNEVVELADGSKNMFTNVGFFSDYNATYLYAASVGKPLGLFYGYVFDGVYQYDDFENTAPGKYVLKPDVPSNASEADRANIQPGDIKYKDLNGDGIVNDNDMTIIGNGNPIHIGGLNNSLRYKNVDLSFLLQWSYGGDLYNANRLLFDGNAIGGKDMNQYATYNNRWTSENPSNTHFRAGGQGPGGRHSSRVIEDGSYLRLKTVSLGYILPKKITDRANIAEIRFNVSAQNLLTWTNYSGMDPEVSTRGRSPLTPGFDYSAYPIAKTIVFGINVTL
jgi:TonB-linked SusC/RagA family outer membrane protein